MSLIVKVFGCRPHDDGATRSVACVRKPPSIELQIEPERTPTDLERLFVAVRGSSALVVADDAEFTAHRSQIAELALRNNLPTGSGLREMVEAGGLMAYGASFRELYRRAASHVYEILRGAKPADLPVEQPTKFELAINLKTVAVRGSSALVVADDAQFTAHRSQIAELALRNNLPAVSGLREMVEAGGLMAYGASFRELYRRAASHVYEILRGAKPADLPVKQPTKFELAINLKTVAVLGPSALVVADDAKFTAHRSQIAELALRNNLPTVSGLREMVEAGGLMAYGASFRELYRRAASHVYEILRGAKPADLPVEQPTKFELAINLKTANALGLEVPPTLLARAEVIE